MLYQVSHGHKSFGTDTVLEDVQFEIKGTEKITIVGRNGCGKSTFLRCMCHEMDFDKGHVSMTSNTTIGYLAQTVLEHDDWTVEEELKAVFKHVFDLEETMHEMENRMIHDHSEKLLMQYAEVQEQYELLNGYNWKSEMMTVFTKFGFQEEDLSKKVNEFSGGQKTRIAFVRLLLSKPDILLLDEPTNHLDLGMIEWLEGYIKHYPRAVVMVSHDRMFLDHTVDVVYDLEYGTMTRYAGNYSHFVEEKKKRIEREIGAYNRQQKEIERMENVIEKFRYKATKAKFAQSKIKELERMDKIDPVQRADDRSFKAHFTPRVKGGENVLDVEKLVVGYDEPLCEVTFKMRRTDRVAIIGANGCGKSTLVKTLMKDVDPLKGSYLFGHQIEIGYFDQQNAQLSSSKTVLEELWDEHPELTRTEIRSVLGQFLFSSDDVFKTVDVLSGGEKVRLSLARLMLDHGNMLILDEPTNHLDIPGKEALEDSVKDFSGSILFVSHDRYFISQIATSLLIMEDGVSTYYPMTYNEYVEMKQGEVEKQVEVKKEVVNEKPKNAPALSPEGMRRKIKSIEGKITTLEETLEEKRELRFDPTYYQDYTKMNELDEEIDDIHNKLAHLYEEWEELIS